MVPLPSQEWKDTVAIHALGDIDAAALGDHDCQIRLSHMSEIQPFPIQEFFTGNRLESMIQFSEAPCQPRSVTLGSEALPFRSIAQPCAPCQGSEQPRLLYASSRRCRCYGR